MNKTILATVTLAGALSMTVNTSAQSDKFLGSIWQWSGTAPAQFSDLFTQTTPENAGKWGPAEPSRGNYQWGKLDAMCAWADQDANRLVKQHTFVWGQQEPSWIGSYTNADTVKAIVKAWMTAYLQRYGDKIDMIDVVNEPLHAKPSYRSHLGGDGTTGWDWVVWTFQTARDLCNQYAPNAKLLLNDYEIVGSDNATTNYLKIINILKDRDLIDGIGEQAHFYENKDTVVLHRNLDRLAETGLPVYISEFDMNFTDDAQQLASYKRVFHLFWSHPAVRGVTLWGYQEGSIWRSNAYLVRSDGSERPALAWLKEYVNSTTRAGRPQQNAPALRVRASEGRGATVQLSPSGAASVEAAGTLYRIDGRLTKRAAGLR